MWPQAGLALAEFEPDDPALAIPHGAFQSGGREALERYIAANHNGLITHRPAKSLGPKPAKSPNLKRGWKLALLASCVFHAAIALFFMQAVDDAVLVEGADFSGITLLGSPEDMAKAGEISETEEATVDVIMVTLLEAVPVETVAAEAVPVDDVAEATDAAEAITAESETLQPAEQVTETAQPLTASPAEHAEPEAVENEPVPAITETAPEVLATDRAELVDDDNFVQQPAETPAADPVEAAETAKTEQVESAKTEQAEAPEAARSESLTAAKVKTDEVAKAEPTETKAKPIEKKAESVKPAKKIEEKKPAARKKTAKPKTEEGKKVAEKAKPKKSGNQGSSEANAVRGQADGSEKGDSKQASRGGSKNGQVGIAAVSNYPGKVRSKLARAARSVRARGRGEVVVAFAVGSNGSVRSARVTRSSGVASVDKAALQAIGKASPFPPIPANAGRSTWEFSIPLAFRR